MAAFSEEVGLSLLSRRLLGEPMLLYRLSDGRIAAMEDRCPHRFAPLSLGTREGDTVVCGYHGLTFNGEGKCVRNPFSSKIPSGADIKSYVTHEQDGFVWFWAGQPNEADPKLIPDFSALTEDWPAPPVHAHAFMKAEYEMGSDNLMDLSHIEFLHSGSFAGGGVIFAGEHTAREEGDAVHSDWWMPNVLAPPYTTGIYPRDMRTDHWFEMRWNAPASMKLEIGTTPVGAPRSEGIIMQQAHIFTPATDTTAHYFWASTRVALEVTEDGDAMMRDLFYKAAGEEDIPFIAATFDNMDGADFWARKPVFLGVDAGATRARRMLQKLIKAESEQVSSELVSAG
jgi:vanillate O-demethylase monooxygenase subunit